MLGIRLLVNSRLLVKFEWNQKLYTNFQQCRGMVLLIPHTVQGSTIIMSEQTQSNVITYEQI